MGMVLMHTIPISFVARVYEGLAVVHIDIAKLHIEAAPVNMEFARVHIMIAALREACAPVWMLLCRR